MNKKGVVVKFLAARTTGNILHQEYDELFAQNVCGKENEILRTRIVMAYKGSSKRSPGDDMMHVVIREDRRLF